MIVLLGKKHYFIDMKSMEACFKLIQRTSSDAIVQIQDPMPMCDGHFPQNPIVPAVVILDLCCYLAQNGNTSLENLLPMIESARFHTIVRPGDQIEVSWEIENGRWYFQVHLLSDPTRRLNSEARTLCVKAQIRYQSGTKSLLGAMCGHLKHRI